MIGTHPIDNVEAADVQLNYMLSDVPASADWMRLDWSEWGRRSVIVNWAAKSSAVNIRKAGFY